MVSYRYKLYQSKKMKALDHMMAEATFVWNHALALQRRFYKLYGSYITAAHMQRHFARRLKPHRLHSQTVQEILQRQDAAYRAFFKRQTRRPPKFRRASDFSSLVFKQGGYRLYGNEFIINKVSKRFRFAKSRDWDGRVKNVRVLRSRGEWFIVVVTDAEPRLCGKSHTGASAGIDFGLKTYMTFSDGMNVSAPLFYHQLLNKIRRCHRLLSKAQKGSANYHAYRRKLNRIYRELADRRSDWNYKTAHDLCRRYDAIFVEDLNVAAMQRLWGRKVTDLGWTSFLSTLDYVASKYGTLVHRIDRFYPSSRLCTCGYKNNTLTLRDRVWTCPQCGTTHNRDLLAAQNIHRRGIADLGSACKTGLAG